MTVFRITPRALRREKELQALIDRWATADWDIAGAPDWLLNLPSPLTAQRRVSTGPLGYGFEPDAIFETEDIVYVAELKLSPQNKYESLALPEVLHHMWMLENNISAREVLGSQKRIEGLIFAPWNTWLIASLALLRSAPVHVHYFAFDTFTHAGRNILWVGAPLAPWALVERDSIDCPDVEEYPYAFWYRLGYADAYVGVDEKLDDRPTLLDRRHVELARIVTGEERASGKRSQADFIACEGSYLTSWNFSLLTSR